MKWCACLFILFPVLCRAGAPPKNIPPKTRDALAAAVRAAFDAKDTGQIHALTWEPGITDFDKNQEQQLLAMNLADSGGVQSISFGPLPPDFMDTPIAWGRRFAVTHPPDGMLIIEEKTKDQASTSELSIPYAAIDGAYYLIGTKSTDLGWTGARDQAITVSVTGTGADKVKIHIKYNASGVDAEMDATSASITFPCQHISEVTLKSDSDATNAVLQLLDQKGEVLYHSAPLTGKGEFVYHKGDASAPGN